MENYLCTIQLNFLTQSSPTHLQLFTNEDNDNNIIFIIIRRTIIYNVYWYIKYNSIPSCKQPAHEYYIIDVVTIYRI